VALHFSLDILICDDKFGVVKPNKRGRKAEDVSWLKIKTAWRKVWKELLTTGRDGTVGDEDRMRAIMVCRRVEGKMLAGEEVRVRDFEEALRVVAMEEVARETGAREERVRKVVGR